MKAQKRRALYGESFFQVLKVSVQKIVLAAGKLERKKGLFISNGKVAPIVIKHCAMKT
jgi:uncharacterized protein YggU (UPF0235/DUF167 family)